MAVIEPGTLNLLAAAKPINNWNDDRLGAGWNLKYQPAAPLYRFGHPLDPATTRRLRTSRAQWLFANGMRVRRAACKDSSNPSANLGGALFKRHKPDETLAGSGATPPPGVASNPTDAKDAAAAAVNHAPTLAAPSAAGDTGLGVPSFRPAPSRDSQSMSRPPLSAAGLAAAPAGGMRPGLAPARPSSREAGERRTLVVGRGIRVQGTVQDAERLIVEGTVEATMIHATELSIVPGGVFKGEVEVEEAEIAGTIDGTLTAHGALVVRSTGQLQGAARCRRLQVEDGGQISGRLEMLTDNTKSDRPRSEAAE
jgi:cytoskeletal protein CcmA (bactofilin family)